MKTCGALLVLLYCCLAEMQLIGETISENDITHQAHYDESESRENEVMGAAQTTEAADTASTQQTCHPDTYTMLREMSVLIAEQRLELRYTKTQLDAVEARLRASEMTVEEQRVDLRRTEARLTARLKSSEILVKQLKSHNEAARVVFSVSLETSVPSNTFTGPFNIGTTLLHKHIFINIGSAYNSNTGFFTAPVKGIYDFSFCIYSQGGSSPVGAFLRKNRHNLAMGYASHSSGFINASNGVSVLLEVGDVVDIYLPAHQRILDNHNHHSTFRGHLLFQV